MTKGKKLLAGGAKILASGKPGEGVEGFFGSGERLRGLGNFDEDVDVQDTSQAAWRSLANVDAKRDVSVVEGPVDVLDHSSPYLGLGAKMGVDATRKWVEEGGREWPEVCVHPPEVIAGMDALDDRLVAGAAPLRRPVIAPPPAAAWSPRKAGG